MILVENLSMQQDTTDFQPLNACATFPSPLGWADILPTLRAYISMPQQYRFMPLRERFEYLFEAKKMTPRIDLVGFASMNWIGETERPDGSAVCQPRSEDIFASISMAKVDGGPGNGGVSQKSEERSDPRRASFLTLWELITP